MCEEEEDIHFPPIAAALEPSLGADLAKALQANGADSPPPQQAADESPDSGASSDGDASWAESPIGQDPAIDRSVVPLIRWSRGL